MRRRLRTWDVRPGEGARLALLFAEVLLVVAAYTMTKAARDALFLSRFGVADLSLLMIALAAGSGLALALLGRTALLAPRNALIAASHGITALSLLAIFWGLRAGAGRWLAWTLYLWSAIFGVFLVAQAWLLANDLFDARAARRLWGPLGTGAILGGILGGRGAALIAGHASAVALLPAAAIVLVAAAVLAAIAWTLRIRTGAGPAHPPGSASPAPARPSAAPPQRPHSPREESRHAPSGWRIVWDDPYLRLLALCVLVSTIGYTLIDWQLKGIAQAHFHGQERPLAGFFGDLYAYVSVLALLLQIGVTSRLLPRRGVRIGLLVLPVVDLVTALLLGSSVAGRLGPLGITGGGIALPAVAKAADGGLRYSVDKSSMELLWLPVPPAVKNRAKPFIDTTIDRLGGGLAGLLWLLLAWLLHLDSEPRLRLVGIAVAALAVLWLTLVGRAWRFYVRALALGMDRPVMAEHTPRHTPRHTIDRLLVRLGAAPPGERQAVLRALARLRHETPEEAADGPTEEAVEDPSTSPIAVAFARLQAMLAAQLGVAERRLAACAALRRPAAMGANGAPRMVRLLERALAEDVQSLLLLCALTRPRHDAAAILAAARALDSHVHRARAHALELLDNLLPAPLGHRVVTLLEAATEPREGPTHPPGALAGA